MITSVEEDKVLVREERMTHKLGNMHSVFVGGLYKYREKCKNLFSDKAAGFSVLEISHDHRIRETPSSMIP